jgi:predicted MFS family arabinose efflux permease
MSGALTLLFATSVGVMVANLPAPQTLVGLIGSSLGLDPTAGTVVAMATQFGYAAGLFLLVPLADLMENRQLTLGMLVCAILAAATSSLMPSAAALLVALFVLGAACSAIQILVPIAASMAAPERRGRVIGDVMSGLMIGMLLSRPLASFTAGVFGSWRAFYGISAMAMGVLAGALAWRLPRHRPDARMSYANLIGSLWLLLRAEPVLRRSALTASLAMAAFSLFWTSVALRLGEVPFNLSQRDIALFALVGVGGAIATPFAGRLGDRGWTRPAKITFHLAIIVAFALSAWAASFEKEVFAGMVLMGFSAVVLDAGVTGEQTLGRRSINLLRPEARGRLNALFVGLFMLGGALGSGMAGIAWAWGRWPMICATGASIGIGALLIGGTAFGAGACPGDERRS